MNERIISLTLTRESNGIFVRLKSKNYTKSEAVGYLRVALCELEEHIEKQKDLR